MVEISQVRVSSMTIWITQKDRYVDFGSLFIRIVIIKVWFVLLAMKDRRTDVTSEACVTIIVNNCNEVNYVNYRK